MFWAVARLTIGRDMGLFAEYKKRDANDTRPRLPSGVSLRWATGGDLSQVAKLSADRNGTVADAELPGLVRALERGVEGQGLFFVAEFENQVAAFAKAAIWDPGSQGALPPLKGWYLTGVVVDSKFRRIGIGEALTQARLAALRRRSDTVRFGLWLAPRTRRASICIPGSVLKKSCGGSIHQVCASRVVWGFSISASCEGQGVSGCINSIRLPKGSST